MTAGRYGSVTLPGSSPYVNMGSWRMELRLHNWTVPASGARHIVGATSEKFFVRLLADNTLEAFNTLDSLFDGRMPVVSLSGRTDVVLRLQRNVDAKTFTLEVWNADGTSRAVASRTIATVGNWNMGTLQFPISWYTSASVGMGYFRWHSTLLPLNSAPPHGSSGGDLLDYEFEGNGTDSSANHKNLTFYGGAAVFVVTPSIAPAANAGADTTTRAGVNATLDASGSIGDGSLSYFWQQTAGPSSVFWSDRSSPTPTITGLIAGQYTFQLRVTDALGATAMDTVNIGAVATDEEWRVITGSDAIDSVLGPLLMYGKGPWPWFDDRHKALADFFGALYTTETGWNSDEWNTALTGTVSVTNGSTTVTGSDTSFQASFCGGGTSPSGNYTIVIWYDNGGGDHGRANYPVAGCPSQTSLTLSTAYTATTGTQSGLSHARWYNYGVWIGNSTNINFYDSVLAHYALYYRTGLTKYRDYARTLADRWYTMPYIDAGRRSSWQMSPRNMAIGGLILRALDGKPEYWTGIEGLLDAATSGLGSTVLIQDIRENGYTVGYVALGALLDPNSSKRASYVKALENALTARWGPQQRTDGSWDMITWGFDTWDYYPCGSTANVTNGDTTVTLVPGCGYNSWSAADVEGGAKLWITANNAHNNKALDDTTYYTPAWIDSTHLTLDRPYEGTTTTGRGWQLQGGTARPYLTGRATQPFQLGIVGTAWYWGYQALTAASSTHAAAARQFVFDVAGWLTSTGYDPIYKGLYWGRNTVTCEPIASHMNDVACRCELGSCTTGKIPEMRYLNSEVLRVFSAAYALTGTASYKTQGDKLFGAMWGKDGGPESDTYYNSEYVDGGWTFATKKAKNLGFAFGFGAGSSWPAARLGTPALPAAHPVSVSFDPNRVPGATATRITVKRPDGSTAQVTCASSPCQVSADARQGDHLMLLEYISASGKALAAGDWAPIAIR